MSEGKMSMELCCCTNTLLDEIKIAKTKKQIAQTYALALKSSEKTDWALVNRSIIDRWGLKSLKYIKELAWSGKCFSQEVQP